MCKYCGSLEVKKTGEHEYTCKECGRIYIYIPRRSAASERNPALDAR